MMAEHHIIIPAYNEEKRIEKTVRDYAQFFEKRAEILVVMNGCRDKTSEIVRHLTRQCQNVRYLEFSEAIGKGRAVQEGFRYFLHHDTRYEIRDTSLIGFVDADEATSPEEYDRVARLMGAADGVIGSRFSSKSVVSGRSFLRGIAGHIFHLIVRMLFRLPYRDTQCGLKVFRRSALEKILPELQIPNMAFDVEILLTARKFGLPIKEVATQWSGKPDSGSLGSSTQFLKSGWKMFMTLLSLKRRF